MMCVMSFVKTFILTIGLLILIIDMLQMIISVQNINRYTKPNSQYVSHRSYSSMIVNLSEGPVAILQWGYYKNHFCSFLKPI